MSSIDEICAKRVGYMIWAKARDRGFKNQTELMDKLNLERSTISSWKAGRSYPRMDTFVDCCKVLNATPNELMGVEDSGEKVIVEAPVEKVVEVPVEKIVYRDRPTEKEPETTTWATDMNGIVYCTSCRCDAPYRSDGTQQRANWCPHCGRRACKESGQK